MAASLLMINHARVSASHQTVRSVTDQLKSCLFLIGLHQNVGVFEADDCLTANT